MGRAQSWTTETGNADMPFHAQVHTTFGFVKEALAVAGRSLDEVVDCQVWLAHAQDFAQFDEIYRRYVTKDLPSDRYFPWRSCSSADLNSR